MKLLMISDFYPPIMGGMERYVSLLSKELVKRGHEVTVCTTKFEHLPSADVDHEVKVLRFEGLFQKMPFLYKDLRRRYHPPTEDFIINKKLKVTIENEKPDIVHAHGWILYSFLRLKTKFDIPLVVTLHGYDLICPKKTLVKSQNGTCNEPLTIKCIVCGMESYGPLRALFPYCAVRLNKKKLRVVDKYIAVSSFVKKVCSEHLGLTDEEVVVIPNFYEREEEFRGRESKMLPDNFVLFVGALSAHKGVDVLINAYKKIDTRTKLVIIGIRHPSYSYKNAKNITIIENAPTNLVKEAYSRCRFVVIPSIFPDPCPTVAFEAMSRKKAIIGSDIGGLKDIVVHGKTGILIPSNDSRKLVQALTMLLSNTKNAEQMGVNGYNRLITHFTSNVVVPRIEETYQKLMKN